MEWHENVLEELEVLKSIYCGPGELYVYFRGDDKDKSITITRKVKINCLIGSCCSIIMMSLQLLPGYPNICPKISINGQQLNVEALNEMKILLEKQAEGLTGQPMMLDLFLHLEEIALSFVQTRNILCSSCSKLQPKSEEETSNKAKGTQEINSFSTALLKIDHMRSRSSYVKKLNQWTRELGLTGCLVFYDWLILLLLQGDLDGIREFLRRLRTVSVDVDCHGRSCRERMAKVLSEPQLVNSEHKRFTTFLVTELTSWKSVKDLFLEHGLDELYNEHVCDLKKK